MRPHTPSTHPVGSWGCPPISPRGTKTPLVRPESDRSSTARRCRGAALRLPAPGRAAPSRAGPPGCAGGAVSAPPAAPQPPEASEAQQCVRAAAAALRRASRPAQPSPARLSPARHSPARHGEPPPAPRSAPHGSGDRSQPWVSEPGWRRGQVRGARRPRRSWGPGKRCRPRLSPAWRGRSSGSGGGLEAPSGVREGLSAGAAARPAVPGLPPSGSARNESDRGEVGRAGSAAVPARCSARPCV